MASKSVLTKQSTVKDFRASLTMVYGNDLDGEGLAAGSHTPGGFSGSSRVFNSNLTEMNRSLRRMGSFKFDADQWVKIPKTLRLDFEFYRTMFLHIRNENFNVSTMQVILSFERLSRLIGADVPRKTVKSLVALQDQNQMISWEKYAEYIDANERTSTGHTRINPGEQGLLSLEKETALVLTIPERISLTMEDSSSSKLALLIGGFRLLVIILSTVGIIIDSEPGLRSPPPCDSPPCLGEPVSAKFLDRIELATVIAFTLDYLLRLGLSGFIRAELLDRARLLQIATGRHALPQNKSFLTRLIAFIFSFFSLIDIVSVVPFYVRLALSSTSSGGLQVFRVIRLVNVIRFLRIKQFREIRVIIARSFSQSLSALAVLTVAFVIVILFFGVLIYFQEAGTWYPLGENVPGYGPSIGAYYRPTTVNPAVYELTPFRSVLMGIWFAVVSATTTGFGDVMPASTLGKVIASLMVMAGVVVLALPIAIIGSNFTAEFEKNFAIRNMLSTHKDKKIQNSIMSEFLGNLNEEEEEMRDASMIFNADDGGSLVNPLLEIRLKSVIHGIPNGANLLDRLEVVGHAKSSADVQSFLSWALADLETLKDKMSSSNYHETKDVIVAIAIDVIRKIPNINTN